MPTREQLLNEIAGIERVRAGMKRRKYVGLAFLAAGTITGIMGLIFFALGAVGFAVTEFLMWRAKDRMLAARLAAIHKTLAEDNPASA